MKLTRTIPFAVVSLFCALAFVACGDSEATGPDCGGTDCGGVCVDTNNDPANCGACGNACASGEVCSAGSCGSSCGTGSTACGGSCVDTNANPNHCGACDAACAAGEVCNAGACAASCGGGTTECSGACVDTMVDPANCGGCDTACGAGEVCTAGACTPTCAAPNVLCEGKCIDPMTDNAYCGASGACTGLSAGVACTGDTVCDGTGNCSLFCTTGLIECGGACINPDTDPGYCGATGDCLAANAGVDCGATGACFQGTCQAACPPATGSALAGAVTSAFGFCFYISAKDGNCDTTCADVGGTNVAVAAEAALADSCSGGGADGQVTHFLFENGNPAGWTAAGATTSAHSLGYGYDPPTTQNYYGKCSTGGVAVGTFPGETGGANRRLVCACFEN